MKSEFRVLIASDGSPAARAALRTALAFPWPDPSRARGVVALGSRPALGLSLGARRRRRLHEGGEAVQRRLGERWPEASVVALHEPAADAILSEARRFRADAIVVGWRGHGALQRMVAGSVSRELVARSRIPVLVARTALAALRRVVIGYDGSREARAAVQFASRLEPRRGSRIELATIVEPLRLPPALRRLPASTQRELRDGVARLNRGQLAAARLEARAAAGLLKRAGWPVKLALRSGIALERLLDLAEGRKGTLLVVGAYGTSGLQRLLLGSVTSGALDRARVPVLVVR